MKKPSAKSLDSMEGARNLKGDWQPQMSGKPLFPLPAGSEPWEKLAECEEFCLYRKPDGTIINIRSGELQMAYWKAKLVINYADGKERSVEDRVRLALALRRLALFTQFSLPNWRR